MQFERDVVWDLTAGRNHDTFRPFKIDDIEHSFERELFEVQTVGHILVGRYCLRIGIDQYRLEFLGLQCLQRLHA